MDDGFDDFSFFHKITNLNSHQLEHYAVSTTSVIRLSHFIVEQKIDISDVFVYHGNEIRGRNREVHEDEELVGTNEEQESLANQYNEVVFSQQSDDET